jgi:PAS domain S-box-containing protein
MVETSSDSDSPDLLRQDSCGESAGLRDAILANPRLSVMATDTNGIIRLFNRGAERMLGFAAGEIVGTPCTTIAPDFAALTCKAARGVEDSYESSLTAKNRASVPASISISMLHDERGTLAGYLLIVTASPHRKRAASDLDLLARLSHELRTPLGAILGYAQLMESSRPAPTVSQKRSLGLILQAGWQLEELIRMTRDLALLEAGDLSLSLEAVPLAAVMLDVASVIDAEARMRRVRVSFPLFETPCFVWADRIRLQQVLVNWLSAAIEFSETDAAIVVNCETQGSAWTRIAIKTLGDGSSLGQPPGRDDGREPETTSPEGTGVGLLLARGLIECMEGAIGAETRVGTRTVFSFALKQVFSPIPHIAFNAADASAANAITG